MILYFNTKLAVNPVFFNSGINITTYSPLLFPKESVLNYPDKIEVLKKTLKSYSKLNFKACIFNIEIDSSEESFREIKE